jgi:hypothetical protein
MRSTPEQCGRSARWPAWLLATLGAFLAAVSHAAPPVPGATTLRLLDLAAFDPQVTLGPPHPGLPHISGYAPGVRGAYLVQFDRPITEADRLALESAGASLKGYVPMLALEVVMRERDRGGVAAIPGVRFVGPVQPSWKIPSKLFDAHPAPSGRLRLHVSLYPGDEDEGSKALQKLGASIGREDRRRSYALAEVEIPAARLHALARHPLVRRVSAAPMRVAHNDRARAISGLALIADDTFSV